MNLRGLLEGLADPFKFQGSVWSAEDRWEAYVHIVPEPPRRYDYFGRRLISVDANRHDELLKAVAAELDSILPTKVDGIPTAPCKSPSLTA
jgi:hypothetical protein